MPKATVSQEVTRKNLNSVEGGFVELRPLSYAQMLERRDNAFRTSQTITGGGKRNAPQKFDLESAQRWTREFEFKNCIVNHNLTDDQDVPLDFGNPMTLEVLDPKVAAEIERYIDDMNQEDDTDLEDFTGAATSSSRKALNGQKEEATPEI